QMPVEAPVPNDPRAWVDVAVRQNLELQASERAVSAAEQTLNQRKAGHAPTVDAVASYRKGDNDSFGYSNPTDFGANGYRDNVAQSSIGIELNIPLYSGGMTNSQIKESTERLYQSQDEQEDRRREVVLNTRNAFRGINTGIEQIAARRQSIVSGQKSALMWDRATSLTCSMPSVSCMPQFVITTMPGMTTFSTTSSLNRQRVR
ncbi:Outer membrane efflux protein, partial [Pseudomonas savastanoi pv. nerii]